MLRDDIKSALTIAMKGKDKQGVSTLRLIMAAIKDRDIAARSKGITDGIGEDEILSIMQSMVKQRRESIEMYEKGGRMELAQQETEEISVIETFMPAQLNADGVTFAIDEAISASNAKSIKDMGKVMGHLKNKYAGRMDFGKAGAAIKDRLG
tara:strand:- start:27 stop:482 length:456 start_codon:yes stop_codon:yes gene_type:complete